MPAFTDTDDYDSPWKEAVEHHFPEFMAFYFPAAHAAIDWSQPPVFLDTELQAVVQDSEFGRRMVDKLVRVTGRAGGEDTLYIHIEIQGTQQASFAERMFVYYYRLFDRYRKPIASLAVLADDGATWKPSMFTAEALGCQLRLSFPVVKLLDYAAAEEDLLTRANPFALLTAAHLATRATRTDMAARYAAKSRLVRLLYERDWDRQRILDLFAVIDWMMRLPDDLEAQLWQDIETLEEDKRMRYVTSVERIGIQKGLQQGRQEGEAGLLLRQLERKFGPVPAWAGERIAAADTGTLEEWGFRVLEAASLEDVFGPQCPQA